MHIQVQEKLFIMLLLKLLTQHFSIIDRWM